jgi:DNA-binding transcriptional MerR regulator
MLEDRDRTFTMDEIEQETGLDRRTIAYYVQEGLLPKVGRRGPRTRYPQRYLDRLLFIKKIRDLQDQGQLGNYTLEDIKEIFETVPERMIGDIVSGREPLEVAPYGRTLRGRQGSLGSPRERIERLRRLSEGQRARDRDVDSSAPRSRQLSWWASQAPASKHPPRPVERPQRTTDTEDSPSTDRFESDTEPSAPTASMEDDEAALFLDLDTPHQELMIRRVVEDVASPVHGLRSVERRAAPPPSTLARMLAQLDESSGRHQRDGTAERWTRAEVTPDIVLTVRGLDEDSANLLERIARVLRGMIETRRRR